MTVFQSLQNIREKIEGILQSPDPGITVTRQYIENIGGCWHIAFPEETKEIAKIFATRNTWDACMDFNIHLQNDGICIPAKQIGSPRLAREYGLIFAKMAQKFCQNLLEEMKNPWETKEKTRVAKPEENDDTNWRSWDKKQFMNFCIFRTVYTYPCDEKQEVVWCDEQSGSEQSFRIISEYNTTIKILNLFGILQQTENTFRMIAMNSESSRDRRAFARSLVISADKAVEDRNDAIINLPYAGRKTLFDHGSNAERNRLFAALKSGCKAMLTPVDERDHATLEADPWAWKVVFPDTSEPDIEGVAALRLINASFAKINNGLITAADDRTEHRWDTNPHSATMTFGSYRGCCKYRRKSQDRTCIHDDNNSQNTCCISYCPLVEIKYADEEGNSSVENDPATEIPESGQENIIVIPAASETEQSQSA